MTTAPRLQTLAEVETALWRELASAALDHQHAWRTPVLATVDGAMADARTVVLREADPEARELRLFTDARSAKVLQIGRHPQGMLVLWCKHLSWQLRLRVALTVQTDGLAVASRWARLKQAPTAQDYLSPLAPGTPLDTEPPRLASERNHFAMVVAHVLAVDWLELHAQGHRRAAFDAAGSRWLTP